MKQLAKIKNISEYIKNIKIEELNTCYSFFGKNDYLEKNIIKHLKQKLENINAHTFDFYVFDIKDTGLRSIINDAVSLPFIAPKKILIVKNIDTLNESDLDFLDMYLTKPSSSACLCLFLKDKRSAVKKVFKQKTVVLKFEDNPKDFLKVWLRDYITGCSKKIRIKTLDLLQSCLSEDMIAVENEMNKLITFIGDKEVIEEEDIIAVLKQNNVQNVFNLMDEISGGNTKEAIRKLNDILSAGANNQELMGLMFWNFKRLWMVFEYRDKGLSLYQAEAKAGIKDWARAKFENQLANYSKQKLKTIFSYLSDLDFKLRINPDFQKTLLEKFIIDISSLSK